MVPNLIRRLSAIRKFLSSGPKLWPERHGVTKTADSVVTRIANLGIALAYGLVHTALTLAKGK